MQRKKWFIHARITYLFLFLLTCLIPASLWPASGSMSRIERALENNKKRLLQQKKSPLVRQKQKPLVIAEKKVTLDLSKLTSRQRRNFKRKEIAQSRIIKHMSEMDYRELLHAKNKHRTQNDLRVALKYIDHMLLLCDPHEAADLTLEAGDVLYEMGEYNKAAEKYKEFVTLHPGNPRIEYALYKAILARFKTTLTFDRDQTRTHETLTLIEQFFDRDSVFTTYTPEVRKMQNDCIQKLAEHDLYITQFYITQKNFKSAVGRIKKIQSDYIAKLPTIENKIKELELLLPEDAKKLLHQEIVHEITPTILTDHKQIALTASAA